MNLFCICHDAVNLTVESRFADSRQLFGADSDSQTGTILESMDTHQQHALSSPSTLLPCKSQNLN